jgi:hypothetical protein
MMQWSCPDIFNAVCRLAGHIAAPKAAHVQALMTVIKYVVSTEHRGLVLSPKEKWRRGYKFKMRDWFWLDSDYGTNNDDHRSISDGRVLVNVAVISFHSVTQKFVALSVTEAKIATGIMIAHDMLYVYHWLESLKLDVELSMLLRMDTSGAVDIVNSWSIGGRTHHVDIGNNFL